MFEHLTVTLARTLWMNTYRARVQGGDGAYLATLRIIPQTPLDPADLPPDAPSADAYLLVLVEDAAICPGDFPAFEGAAADMLLAKMRGGGFEPQSCTFFYPSPAFMMEPGGKH